MDPSIPPPASVEPPQNRFQDPAAATVRTRQVEIITTYHSSDPYCKSCTKLQDDTLERIIALHKRPCDILDFLGTYERPTPKRTTLTRYPQTRMERIAAHWGWFAEVTAPQPFSGGGLTLPVSHTPRGKANVHFHPHSQVRVGPGSPTRRMGRTHTSKRGLPPPFRTIPTVPEGLHESRSKQRH
jgi:hypothetical protein